MKTIVQFSFKYATLDQLAGKCVVDCRVMTNPYKKHQSEEYLKNQVRKAPQFMQVVVEAVEALRNHDEVYVGCHYGKHRSGAVAEEVARLTGATITKAGSNA